jgi:hypothetical protein
MLTYYMRKESHAQIGASDIWGAVAAATWFESLAGPITGH